MISMNHIQLQFARLVRHMENAKSGDDPISYLDLTHCLRIWADMKREVDGVLALMDAKPRFKHTIPARRVKKMLKGSGYTFLHLPTGVKTTEGKIQGLMGTDRVLSEAEVEELGRIGPPIAGGTDLTFSEWLGSEIIETTKPSPSFPERVGISREMLIRRVANFLGASHPAGMESSTEFENRFDQHIRSLHETQVLGGIRLTYYQLSEIAQHIVETLYPLFGDTQPSNNRMLPDITSFQNNSISVPQSEREVSEMSKLVKIVHWPFHPNFEVVFDMVIKVHLPYSENEVTVQISPNITDYQDRPSSHVRQVVESRSIAETRTLKFDFKDNNVHTVAFENVDLEVKDFEIKLMRIDKVHEQGQDFPFFEFLVTKI